MMITREGTPLRITVIETRPGDAVVLLEGHLTHASWAELDEVRAACGDRRLSIDLAGLLFVDPLPARRLAAWRHEGVQLRGGSGFVRELLRTAERSDTGARPLDAEGGNP
jgi:hypothetical protein